MFPSKSLLEGSFMSVPEEIRLTEKARMTISAGEINADGGYRRTERETTKTGRTRRRTGTIVCNDMKGGNDVH